MLSLATCVEVGGKVLRGGVFHASQATEFPRCRPCLLGSGRDATQSGSGPARPSPAVFALPAAGGEGRPGPGLHRAPDRGGSEGGSLSRRELRERPPSGAAPRWPAPPGGGQRAGTCLLGPGARARASAPHGARSTDVAGEVPPGFPGPRCGQETPASVCPLGRAPSGNRPPSHGDTE